MTTKTCSTCKWMRNPGPEARCVAPRNVRPNDSTGFGGGQVGFIACATHRGVGWSGLPYDCGPKGRFWEPATPSEDAPPISVRWGDGPAAPAARRPFLRGHLAAASLVVLGFFLIFLARVLARGGY